MERKHEKVKEDLWSYNSTAEKKKQNNKRIETRLETTFMAFSFSIYYKKKEECMLYMKFLRVTWVWEVIK